MNKLHFPLTANLTAADKLVLTHLQKDFEQVHWNGDIESFDAAEESDDPFTKRKNLESPSPGGKM